MRNKLSYATTLMLCRFLLPGNGPERQEILRQGAGAHHQRGAPPDTDAPHFGTFDNIAFKLNGYDVTLFGQVVQASLKSDAERVVKKIEGVEHVDNRIEVLPTSGNDDRLRRDLFNAIYRYARSTLWRGFKPPDSDHREPRKRDAGRCGGPRVR